MFPIYDLELLSEIERKTQEQWPPLTAVQKKSAVEKIQFPRHHYGFFDGRKMSPLTYYEQTVLKTLRLLDLSPAIF